MTWQNITRSLSCGREPFEEKKNAPFKAINVGMSLKAIRKSVRVELGDLSHLDWV
jgi:hypothetical protein